MSRSPLRRFTDRVALYVRYRPSYPAAVVPFLQEYLHFDTGHVVVDVGSGTGKLSEVFLRAGHRVVGVEPNDAMRQAAEEGLGGYPGFTSLAGSAEQMPLQDGSAACIVAGQAFHWFDRPQARREFKRVLRPQAGVALLWNNRRTGASAFLREFDDLLRLHCPEYPEVGNKHYDEGELRSFFGNAGPARQVFENAQRFDFEALYGRVLSSSYVPMDGPAHDALMHAVRELFDRREVGGTVTFHYDTEVFYGQLA